MVTRRAATEHAPAMKRSKTINIQWSSLKGGHRNMRLLDHVCSGINRKKYCRATSFYDQFIVSFSIRLINMFSLSRAQVVSRPMPFACCCGC
jgi:hypothetical protein